MAAGRMPKLKEPWVCETDCAHRDCAAWRKLAQEPCRTCGKVVEPLAYYYMTDGHIEHARCVLPDEAANG